MTELLKKIGGYRVQARLDKGGQRGVYKATDAAGRVVAITLYPAGESDAIRLRRREILRLARDLEHENIVRVLGSGEYADSIFAVTEFFRGSSLRQLLEHRRLDTRNTIEVLRGAARGLSYANGNGLSCESVDPGHILVHGEGRAVKVIDVGMPAGVLGMDSDSTATPHSLGAVRYLAPERMTTPNEGPDERAMVYSLGVVGYELLTGTFPAGGLRLPSQLRGDVPPEIDPLILRCLAERPSERFPSLRVFAEALDDLKLRVPALQGRIGEGAAVRVQATARNWKVLLTFSVIIIIATALLALRGC